MKFDAERQFPVRVKLGIPVGGLGLRLNQVHKWLDENAGADGWAMTPAGIRGVVNDALAIHFLDVNLAAAFVARWCAGGRAEVANGVFTMREDAPPVRKTAAPHSSPPSVSGG
jgi:hypothetical protein